MCIFLKRKFPILTPYMCFSIKAIFNEFLEVFKWFFKKVKSNDFMKIHHFELESKN